MPGVMVIASYQPKSEKTEELIKLLRHHVPTLRQLGFATHFPGAVMLAEDGNIVEIFEWDSEEASKKATDHPRVQKIWSDIRTLCNFVPLSSLTCTQVPFAHLKRVPAERSNRVVHFEIYADEPERCAKFYRHLFHWDVHQWSNQPYWVVNTGDDAINGINGGILKRFNPKSTVYNTIHVDNLDKVLSEVSKYGGDIIKEKTPVEGLGWLAYAQDTEGNVFGLMERDTGAK
jgi:predicted enzyme related to lactoylglutathione lyase